MASVYNIPSRNAFRFLNIYTRRRKLIHTASNYSTEILDNYGYYESDHIQLQNVVKK
ncbi:hypothetical protein SK128_019642, partial [Halocaridina rubra]